MERHLVLIHQIWVAKCSESTTMKVLETFIKGTLYVSRLRKLSGSFVMRRFFHDYWDCLVRASVWERVDENGRDDKGEDGESKRGYGSDIWDHVYFLSCDGLCLSSLYLVCFSRNGNGTNRS